MKKISYSSDTISTYEFKELNDTYYKILLRENITKLDSGKTSYDEYSIIKAKSDDLESDIKTNFDLYIENAKLQEAIDLKDQEIKKLKETLSSSDYKLLKCTESYMIGTVLPYDFSQLLSERMNIRDQINNIETGEVSDDDLLTQAKDRKISGMSAISQTTITNGIDYDGSHYRLNTTDQLNLTSLYAMAQTGASVPYHADGEVCKVFTAEQMINLVQTSIKFITYHTTYFNLLKHQIMDYTTIEEVEAVYYGIDLKAEYQTIIDAITGA